MSKLFTGSYYRITGVPRSRAEKTHHTYRNYLECFGKFLQDKYSNPSALFTQLNVRPATFEIDEKVVRRFLFIAWNTEYLSSLNDSQKVEILKTNNQWKPIQIYYAAYSLGEAVSLLIDGKNPESHNACIDKVNRLFVESLKIEPWCFAYNGNRRGGYKDVNLPAGTTPTSNLKQDISNRFGIIARCLRAEHDNQVDDFEPRKLSLAQKLRGEKKKLQIDFDPSYTTLFDFLYRLRIKSNYKDAEIFLVDCPDESTQSISKNLSIIGYYTLMLMESYIIKKWDKEKFLKLAKEYLKTAGADESRLKHRVTFYSTL